MAGTSSKTRRGRGHIRRRGGSFQVLVYAGVDPLNGKDHYLTESTRDEAEAQKILTRLLAQVDEQRNPRTKATFGAALDAWLRTHEAEETTLDGYRGYVRRTIEPALATVPLAKLTPQVLEEFYAELRRCRHRCRNGEPAVDHRTTADARLPHGSPPAASGTAGPDAARLRDRRLRDRRMPTARLHAHGRVLDPAGALDHQCRPRGRSAMGVDPIQPGRRR